VVLPVEARRRAFRTLTEPRRLAKSDPPHGPWDYFLARFGDAPPAVRAKVAVFLKVNTVIAVLLAANVVVVEQILARDWATAIEIAWIAVIAVAFWLLRMGRYGVASSLTIAVVLISLCLLGYEDPSGGAMFAFTKLAFLLAPGIVYAFLVGVGRWPAVWATAFSLLCLGAFFVVRLSHEIVGGPAGGEVAWLVSSCLVIVAMGYMAHVASTIYLDAIESAEENARESRDSMEEIRRAGIRFRTIFDSINEAVFIHDAATGRIIDVNRKTTEIFGWSPAEAVDLKVAQWSSNVPPYTQRGAERWMAKARAGQTPTFEWQAKARDGRIFWVEVNVCQANIDGQDRLLVTVRDIARRKHEEEQRAQLEERLRQSEKMDAIGHLAGGIAHDFNNQLTGILGYAEMLRFSVKDPDEVSFAEHIVRASRRSADLTRQLLTFARKGNYQIAPVNIHTLIGEVVALLERSIDKRIAIRTDLAARLPVVMGDATQLQNALLNLAINARDAMPDGGEIVFASRLIESDAPDRKESPTLSRGPWLRIVVADTGCGMSEETLKRIFEPFFTTKEAGKGTGMGLAAVYGAVQIHKGAISVDSTPGRGTTFEIDLPLAATEAVEKGHETDVPARIAKAHVLVVDDEPHVRDLLGDMLRRAGCEVRTCQDGIEAIALFSEVWREIDVVILDMVLPRMGGRDIFAALRRIDPKINVLLVSGYSLDGETQSLLDAGARGFLEKPFHLATLLQMVGACGRRALR
jgi:PAS domain S-box-containing protein